MRAASTWWTLGWEAARGARSTESAAGVATASDHDVTLERFVEEHDDAGATLPWPAASVAADELRTTRRPVPARDHAVAADDDLRTTRRRAIRVGPTGQPLAALMVPLPFPEIPTFTYEREAPPEGRQRDTAPPLAFDPPASPSPSSRRPRAAAVFASLAVGLVVAAIAVLLRPVAVPLAAGRGAMSIELARQGVEARGAQPGTILWVDGMKQGELPLRLERLATGPHDLRFDAGPRYRSRALRVEVEAGVVKDLGTLALEPRLASLELDAEPASTTVWLTRAGAPPEVIRGPWPRTVDRAPGEYTVVARRVGYTSHIRRVTLRAGGRPTTLTCRLQPDGLASDRLAY